MNQLRILKLAFRIEVVATYHRQNFIGNKLRGAIGEAMVRLYGGEGDEENEDCIYRQVFKPIRISEEFDTQPAPFVLGVAEIDKPVLKKGEKRNFYVTLFGDRVAYWKQLILSVIEAFKNSDKYFNKCFRLLEIYSVLEKKSLWKGGEFLNEPFAAVWKDSLEATEGDETEIEIVFHTTPLTKNKDYPEFPDFMDAIFYRIGSIIDLYEEDNFWIRYGLLHRKPKVEMQVLKRGDCPILVYSGKIEDYLPYIDLGESLHIGKKTTYGFGEYQYFVK